MSPADPGAQSARPLLVEIRQLRVSPVSLDLLQRAAREALTLSGGVLDCLSLVLVDAERMSRLHREFLDREGPTDVIAFPAEETDEGLCGEAILCVEVAQEQAREQGHSPERELALLAAHGLLHTVGFSDDTEEGRARMSALQEQAADRALAGTAPTNR